jgi:predicted acylesterase/phospholipase RssA
LTDSAETIEGFRDRLSGLLADWGAELVEVLKVLEELRVPIDCIVGTSMGAIIGGAYAHGVTPQELEQRIATADWESVLLDQAARVQLSVRDKELDRVQLGGPEFGLHRGDPVTSWRDHRTTAGSLSPDSGRPQTAHGFDALPIPFRALATDIETGNWPYRRRQSTTAMREHGSTGSLRAVRTRRRAARGRRSGGTWVWMSPA